MKQLNIITNKLKNKYIYIIVDDNKYISHIIMLINKIEYNENDIILYAKIGYMLYIPHNENSRILLYEKTVLTLNDKTFFYELSNNEFLDIYQKFIKYEYKFANILKKDTKTLFLTNK